MTKDIDGKNVATLAKSKQLKKRVIFPDSEDEHREEARKVRGLDP